MFPQGAKTGLLLAIIASVRPMSPSSIVPTATTTFQLALQDSIGGRPITAFQRCAASRGPLLRSTLTVPRYDVLSRSCCSAIALLLKSGHQISPQPDCPIRSGPASTAARRNWPTRWSTPNGPGIQFRCTYVMPVARSGALQEGTFTFPQLGIISFGQCRKVTRLAMGWMSPSQPRRWLNSVPSLFQARLGDGCALSNPMCRRLDAYPLRMAGHSSMRGLSDRGANERSIDYCRCSGRACLPARPWKQLPRSS